MEYDGIHPYIYYRLYFCITVQIAQVAQSVLFNWSGYLGILFQC